MENENSGKKFDSMEFIEDESRADMNEGNDGENVVVLTKADENEQEEKDSNDNRNLNVGKNEIGLLFSLHSQEGESEQDLGNGQADLTNAGEFNKLIEKESIKMEHEQKLETFSNKPFNEDDQQSNFENRSELEGENMDIGFFEMDLDSNDFLQQVAGSFDQFKENDDCFWKGCKWSPDGLCILTNSDDNILRIFNLPSDLQQNDSSNQGVEQMNPALKMKEGETIYDYDWYPYMTSYEPSSCCLISTSKDHPIHLWDAFTGHIRCSYLAYNHLDELVAANSLAFNLDGTKIYCGFNKMFRIFDSSRPGRVCEEYPTVVKHSIFNQSGIISCISFTNQISKMFALGSFAKSVGVYSESDSDLICMLPGKLGGITQIQFSKDGSLLYAGARRDGNIFCWDLRKPNEMLYKMKRVVSTNQKIQFDIHWSNRYLFSANTNGLISGWDLNEGEYLQSNDFHAHNDAVNGLSLHPYFPLIASTSGQRHFNLDQSSSSENEEFDDFIDNSLKIWKYRQRNC